MSSVIIRSGLILERRRSSKEVAGDKWYSVKFAKKSRVEEHDEKQQTLGRILRTESKLLLRTAVYSDDIVLSGWMLIYGIPSVTL